MRRGGCEAPSTAPGSRRALNKQYAFHVGVSAVCVLEALREGAICRFALVGGSGELPRRGTFRLGLDDWKTFARQEGCGEKETGPSPWAFPCNGTSPVPGLDASFLAALVFGVHHPLSPGPRQGWARVGAGGRAQ